VRTNFFKNRISIRSLVTIEERLHLQCLDQRIPEPKSDEGRNFRNQILILRRMRGFGMLDDWPIRALCHDVAPIASPSEGCPATGLALTERRSLLEDYVVSSELVAVDTY
jgi:hypothetical protein